MWKILEKVMLDIKLRFWWSRRVVTTAETFQIHVKNENDPWCVLAPISQLLLGQKWKVRPVLKSWQQALFKTDLTFWIWWRFDENIAKNNKIQKFLGTPFSLMKAKCYCRYLSNKQVDRTINLNFVKRKLPTIPISL